MRKAVKSDIILILALVILAGAIWLWQTLSAEKGGIAKVTVDGEIAAEYPLGEDISVVIEGIGGVNRLVISDGEAYMTDADCPDRLCVKQGRISSLGEMIICLPHRVIVEVTEEAE